MSVVTKESNPELYNALFSEDEIKAILEFLDDNLWVKYGNTYQKSLTDKECKLLLDYITNLQEENQKLNNKTKRLNNKIKVLEHNCKQAEDSCRQHRLANKNKKRRLQRREEQINLYKTRNEKAIEDLKKTKELNDKHILARDNIVVHLDIDHIDYLLNLLQGKSDE